MNSHDPSSPIGIFDSGIGGLTVAKAIHDLLPHERIVYFGDTAHLPYGNKSPETVLHYSRKIVQFLAEQNCKLIVIACNTASANAFDAITEDLNGSIILLNVIDPMVEGICADSSISKVGIIGTSGTINSNIYPKKLHQACPKVKAFSQATPLLASMIEAGFYDSNISQAIITKYLSSRVFDEMDAMILACTHYPLIKTQIDYFYNHSVKIFDSTDFVAIRVQKELEAKSLLSEKRKTQHHFYVSDFTDSFESTTKVFYTEQIHLEHMPLWGDE